jgi:hypothetical protein
MQGRSTAYTAVLTPLKEVCMSTAYVKYPQLDREQMQRLQSLERELGVWVVAVEPQAQVAQLPPDKLQRLQQAEKEMGLVLLAYTQA